MAPPLRPFAAALTVAAVTASLLGAAPALAAPPGHGTTPGTWPYEPSAKQLAAAGDNGRDDATAEQFYFVLPDRFANGDTGNDAGGYDGDRLSTGLDPADTGFYHGGDLAGLIDKIDYIKELGTTALWLAPVFKNRPVQGEGDDVSAGYHGYWITDFTRIDPHFGTNEQLDELIDLAHERGMKVYLDVITNHTADVIRYAEDKYSYVDKESSPYTDAEGREFEDANYADGDRGFPDVDDTSYPYTPALTGDDADVKVPAWLNDPAMYHNRGDSTFAGESSTYGDFAGLDDLWTERPEVVKGITDIYEHWIGSTGIDGFRIDTVKHVNMEFWRQFMPAIQEYAESVGKPDFFSFGEVYSSSPAFTSDYVREGELPATLDFAFQQGASAFATGGGDAAGLAAMYAEDELYNARDTGAERLPTFLGNHDMGRIGYFLTTSGADPSTYLRRDQLAHELMFLTRGQPVVYYGDEQGFTGDGGDRGARQDMFANQAPSYRDDDLIGTDRTHAGESYDASHPLYRTIASLGELRERYPGLRDGVQVTRHADEGPGVFAFSRVDPDERREYVVAVNNGDTARRITVDTYSPGTSFASVYGDGAAAAAGADGKLTITVPALSSIAYRANSLIPNASAAPTIRITSPVDGAPNATTAEVTAEVTGDPLATVTVAAKVDGGKWTMLGIANRAPYQVSHDLTGLAGGTRIEYKAVVKDSKGRLATAKSTATVGSPEQTASGDWLLVHYSRDDGAYDDWGLYTWGDIAPEWGTTWPDGQPFAGEDSYGRFAWVKLAPGAKDVGFIVVNSAGEKDVATDRHVDPSQTTEIWLRQGDPEIYPSRAAATGQAVIHYGRDDGAYDGWGLHLWGDGLAEGVPTDWSAPRQPDGSDEYGVYWTVPLADASKPVNFIVHRGDEKDPGPDQSIDPTALGEAWIASGDATVHPTLGAAENTAVLHYRRADGDYTGWGVHVWAGAADPTDWQTPLAPARFDAYGAVFEVPLADDATSLSYIIHKGDEKDLPADQSLDLADAGHEVWLRAGEEGRLGATPPGAGKDIDITKAEAQWIDRETIAWKTGPTDGLVYDLVAAPDGGLSIVDGDLAGEYREFGLSARGDGLTERQRQKHPHLWDYQAFGLDRVKQKLGMDGLKDLLRGQLVVTERDHEGALLSATAVQIPSVLDDVYADAAKDTSLGARFYGPTPYLAVWAPTAQDVTLELYDSSEDTSPRLTEMRFDARTGIWRAAGSKSWKGKYYTYRVTAWQPAAQDVVTASVTDPYSLSLATDSARSQIVNLSDKGLAPSGWNRLVKPEAPDTPHIQEVSIRDFSIADETLPEGLRGTYQAFTEEDSAGMTQLTELADAGVSYLHLLPSFDFATIPEDRADQAVPPCDLAALPPDSAEQQECIGRVAASDGYNWGYDPLHYTVPEGGYATDPDGTARIEEYREMVAALNGAGLRVVLDVVYNHTSASGTDPKSVLDQIVPGYYHRLLEDGTVATSTCCANTAPEHAMMGKLVVDSVVTWARDYKVDGFRFDLMGHHPKENILDVREALDRLTLKKDRVDGKNVILYGEGWDFGEVAGDARFEQATQANMAGTGIGTFNDRLRDAVRGGGPFDENPHQQGFASGLHTDPNGDPVNGTPEEQRARLLHQQDLIKVGLTGNLAGYEFTDSAGNPVTGSQVDYNGAPAGYTLSPSEAMTYVDAHDNEILYDALAYKLPAGTAAADRARMQVLALSTVVFGQGTGFVTAGSERLRSKSLDKNSYDSGDWFNQIRWDCADGNGFGAGLPPAADNEGRWPYARPLLADPALVPDCPSIDLADARYRELLRIRGSSPVFGLGTAGEVQDRLAFPLSGTAAEAPGVITMTLDGTGIDPQWTSVVVVFNANPAAVTQTVPGMAGASDVDLHPVLPGSADPALAGAGFDAATGTFTVPGRTVAVFVRG